MYRPIAPATSATPPTASMVTAASFSIRARRSSELSDAGIAGSVGPPQPVLHALEKPALYDSKLLCERHSSRPPVTATAAPAPNTTHGFHGDQRRTTAVGASRVSVTSATTVLPPSKTSGVVVGRNPGLVATIWWLPGSTSLVTSPGAVNSFAPSNVTSAPGSLLVTSTFASWPSSSF